MGKRRSAAAAAAEAAAEASQRMDAPPELPEPLLVEILARVPLQARLVNCAPVCSAWAAAAVKAPSALEVYLGGPAQCRQLQGWLAKHGNNVTRLDLAGHNKSRLQLPCAQLTSLQELQMRHMNVGMLQQQVGTGSSRGGSSRGGSSTTSPNSLLPALRELHLVSCSLTCDGLRQLSCFSSLTDLHLERLTCSDLDSTRQLLPQVLCDVLQQAAPRLARLHLTGLEEPIYVRPGSSAVVFGAAALSPLSAMQQLQEATFSSNILTTDCLQYLPTSLMSLDVEWGDHYGLGDYRRLSLTHAAWPQLPQHTCLQELRLNGVDVQPSILPLLAGSLRRLRLECVWEAADAGIEYEGEDALLHALGSLTQLQELVTCNQHFLSSDEQHMSALTASSQLCKLSVYEDFDGDVGPTPLPPGAMQHMFPAGRQLPHLRELRVGGNMTTRECEAADLHPNIDQHDVTSMVIALPALDSLVLVNVLTDEEALMQLAALQPRLTSLVVGGSYMDDKSIRHLEKLTTLQDLTVRHTFVETIGLLYLTALRRLTRLEVADAPELAACVCNRTVHSDTGFDDFDVDEFGSMNFDGDNNKSLLLYATAEAQARGVPPVWRQLRERCERDPKCLRALEKAAARQKAQGQHTQTSGTAAKAKGRKKK